MNMMITYEVDREDLFDQMMMGKSNNYKNDDSDDMIVIVMIIDDDDNVDDDEGHSIIDIYTMKCSTKYDTEYD